MFYFDYMYFLYMIPGLIISVWAQMKVKGTFAKYSKIRVQSGLSGAQAARQILDDNGLHNVRVEKVSGKLSDHFDPSSNVVRLSDSTYDSTSVGAVGVAAHEVGHAIQHAQGYAPAKLRSAIVPACNIGTSVSMPLIFLGFAFSLAQLIYVGIALFGLAVVFQLVTLPVEFNASKRAIETLGSNGMMTEEENNGVKKVLSAAALTYVAALVTSLLQLLYYISRIRRN